MILPRGQRGACYPASHNRRLMQSSQPGTRRVVRSLRDRTGRRAACESRRNATFRPSCRSAALNPRHCSEAGAHWHVRRLGERARPRYKQRLAAEYNSSTETRAASFSISSDLRSEESTIRHPGWILVIAGLSITGIGLVWALGPSIPGLGRLPGDITIERGNFRLYFPLTTCIVASLAPTALVWLVRYFSR
jgi:hypothetical protein